MGADSGGIVREGEMTELERARIELANRVADKVLEAASRGPRKPMEWPGTVAISHIADDALADYERLVREDERQKTDKAEPAPPAPPAAPQRNIHVFFDQAEIYYELPTGELQDAIEALSESAEYRTAAIAFAEEWAKEELACAESELRKLRSEKGSK